MNCLAILDSGNYVFNLCSILEKKGYVFEVISTPCQIARGGCGYCLKFPEEFKDLVIQEADKNKKPVRALYLIVEGATKNKYARIF